MKAKAPKKDARIHEAVQGFACPCSACETGTSGTDVFCALCGHGYIDLRTGRADDANMGCAKCGAVGQFVDAKPNLPEAPVRQYRIRVQRTVHQTSEVVCSGQSPAAALARARDYANDGITWHDDPNDIGIHAPFSVTPLSVDLVQEAK
jgi:hypothetical protein